ERPLDFAAPHVEAEELPALNLSEWTNDEAPNTPPYRYIEFVDISDPQITCWPVGYWNWYYPGQAAFACSNTAHTVTTFSFRIRYTHELAESASFVVTSGELTADLDSTCEYQQFLLGSTPTAAGLNKECFN